MYSKRQIVVEAFGELGLHGHIFDITPDELMSAVRRLDSMVAAWEAKGVRLGYAFSASPADLDPDDASGLPDSAVETVSMNLAVILAPGLGKILQPGTKKAARDGYDVLLWDAARPKDQQLREMPAGAGNRNRVFTPSPVDRSVSLGDGEAFRIG